MVLKLYGSKPSTNTSRVLTVLAELNIPFEFVLVDLTKREHKDPGFTANQPFGQVPYIDDDGFVLFESRAIARYIALKFGGIGKLIPDPTDVQKTALFEQAASIELTDFDPPASALGFEVVVKARKGIPTDLALVERLKETLEAKIAVYDVLLSKTKYIAGDEITLVDLFHLPQGARLSHIVEFLQSGKYPNVARWWSDISSRPSWTKSI